MTTQLAPLAVQRFFDNAGLPAVGGSVYTYQAGTTTPQATYTDSTGGSANTNPIILNTRGEAGIWLTPGLYYKFVVKDALGNLIFTVDNLSADGGVSAFISSLSATTGAGLVGWGATLTFAANTLGWGLQLTGTLPEWFGAKGDGATDDTASVAAAITFVAALTGPQYGDTMGQAPFGYGDSRRLKLSGKKYLINSTLTLANDIGIYAEGGGFLAGPSFSAAAYMIDTGSNPYGGRIIDLTLDGAARNVKGIRIQNAHMTRWRGLSVVNCANDGITYQAGAEFFLDGFEVSGCVTPTAVTVAGLRNLGSDAHFLNGVIKYTPIGVYNSGGGNNEYISIHCWGLYASFKQYVSFWSVNAVRNMYIGCYADSPAKQDYTQANTVVLNGIPNGGVGFYFDATSAQNTVTASRAYINTSAWTTYATANSITGNHFYDIYSAGSFTNVTDLIHNYAGNWLGDILWASNAVRDSSLVVGSPNTANGIRAAIIASISDAGGGVQNMSVENTNAGFATSESRFTWRLGGGDTTYAGAVFGPGGAPYWYINHIGAERFRILANGSIQPGADSTQNFGAASFRWATIFASTGTINTSDQREKQDIASLTDAEKAVGTALKGLVKSYRWKASVAEKGTDARTHVGWIAQDVMAAFTAQGLDPMAYGVCCYDKWDAEPETVDEDGKVTRAALAAGDRYGVRHDELVAFILGAT